MKSRPLIRAVLLVPLGWLAWWLWKRVEDDPVAALLYCLVMGVLGGIFAVVFILPWFADAIGTSIFLSGEAQAPDTEKDEHEGADLADNPPDEVNKDTQS